MRHAPQSKRAGERGQQRQRAGRDQPARREPAEQRRTLGTAKPGVPPAQHPRCRERQDPGQPLGPGPAPAPVLTGRAAAQVGADGAAAPATPVGAQQQRADLIAGLLAGLLVFAQAGSRLAQHLAHRTGKEIERLGYLPSRQSRELAQGQNLPGPRRQGPHILQKLVEALTADHGLGGVGVGVDPSLVQLASRAAAGTEQVHRLVVCDPAQPGLFTLGPGTATQGQHRPHGHVLQDIESVLLVAHEPPAVSDQGRLVPPEHLLKRLIGRRRCDGDDRHAQESRSRRFERRLIVLRKS